MNAPSKATLKGGPPESFTDMIVVSYAWRWVPARWIRGNDYDAVSDDDVYVRGRWESYITHGEHRRCSYE